MVQLENPQDQAMEYALHVHSINIGDAEKRTLVADWQTITVPSTVKLATDPQNPLKKYY
jgi:hypothetical protein